MRLSPLLRTSILLVPLSVASAATVSFSTPQVLADDGSNLVTLPGFRLAAINFSTNPVRSAPFSATNPDPNPVINGISFTGMTAAGGNNTYFFSNATNTDQARQSGRPSTAAIYPLIYDEAISANNSTPFDLTLRNLVVGLTYELQLVFSSSNNRSLTVDSGGVTSATVNYGVTNGPALLRAVFEADATTQMFRMNGLGLNNRTQLSGFVLTQTVPEPRSLALALVGLLGVAWRMRKRPGR